MLAHNVYFTLKDGSDEAVNHMIAACQKYLKDHRGVKFFAAGRLVPDLAREVNVVDFHVALHVVFETREDHDQYQIAPTHLQFIQENKAGWERVRVYDSYVD